MGVIQGSPRWNEQTKEGSSWLLAADPLSKHSIAMAAHISCVCGKVQISFLNPEPQMRLECGCCDCRQALQWAEVEGGPKSSLLCDLWYFANRFTFLKGKELTRWYKLRESGSSVRCVANCCKSTLLVQHPAYREKVVMVTANGCKLTLPDISMEQVGRIHMKDVPEEKISLVSPFKGQPVDPKALDINLEEVMHFFMKALDKEVEDGEGSTTGKEVEEHGWTAIGAEHYKWLV